MSRSPLFDKGMTILECSPENRRPGPAYSEPTSRTSSGFSTREQKMWAQIADMAPERTRPYRPPGRECAIVHCRQCGRMVLVLVGADGKDPVVRRCLMCAPARR